MQESQNYTRQDSLIERVTFFSDAVFAIAITLMILEIHPPTIERLDSSAIVWQKLAKKLPEFLGLIISFILIGSAWLRHHQLFGYIARYDLGLLVVNLALLFTIILFPFSTSFLFNSLFDGIVTPPQVLFYLAVPLFSNAILYIMYKMAYRKYLNDLEESEDRSFRRAVFEQGFIILSFLLALTWVLVLPFAYHPFGYVFLSVGPIASIIKSKASKKVIPAGKLGVEKTE